MRRAAGVAIALLPFAVIGFCVLTPHRLRGVATVPGYVLLVLGGLTCVLNAHLAWIRPRLHLARRPSLDDHEHASGIPLFGTILVTIGLVCVPPSLLLTLLALLLIVADTGSFHWFVLCSWTDRELWDASGDAGSSVDRAP